MAKDLICPVCHGLIKRKQKTVQTSTRPPIETMKVGGRNPSLSGSAVFEIASCEKCGLMYDLEVLGLGE